MCVAVAEWSKELPSFFCVCSRDSLVFDASPATAHIGRPHSLWTATLGTDRITITRSVLADSVRYMNIGVANKYVPSSFGGGEGKTATEMR